MLASNGIDKPVLNVFRMFSRMQGRRLPVSSDGALALESITRDGVRGAPDVGALASGTPGKVSILLWHYHDDDLPGPDAVVALDLNGLKQGGDVARMTHWRIDQDHSNAFTRWIRMGSPQDPTAAQYTELEQAGKLGPLEPPLNIEVDAGKLTVEVTLPRQAVSLLEFEWP